MPLAQATHQYGKSVTREGEHLHYDVVYHDVEQ